MVVYKKDSALTTVTPVLTDKIRGLDDPSGTPESVTFLLSALRTLIGENLDGVKINDTSDNHQYILSVSELTADRTITLPLLTGNDVFVFADFIQTLTNKRITPRVGSTTSSATPTINTDNVDFYHLTAQTADITSFTTNLSGTPTDNQKLWIAVTGTAARAITWGASFEAGAVALPTTTVTTQRLDVGFIWNAVTSKWRCMASGSA